ncbi:MAG: carboxypeptidase-like regulatory domain-containing protein [Bacteroidales bacterium]
MPGYRFTQKGTTNGTTTNIDGKYTLNNVPADGILVFSFVGMVTQEIPISNKTQINAVLETRNIWLDEVVVIG